MHPKRDQNSKFSPWPWCGCPVGSDSHALKAVKNICEPNGSKNSKRKASILVAVKVFFFFPVSKLPTFLPSPQLALGLMDVFGGVQKMAQRGSLCVPFLHLLRGVSTGKMLRIC